MKIKFRNLNQQLQMLGNPSNIPQPVIFYITLIFFLSGLLITFTLWQFNIFAFRALIALAAINSLTWIEVPK